MDREVIDEHNNEREPTDLPTDWLAGNSFIHQNARPTNKDANKQTNKQIFRLDLRTSSSPLNLKQSAKHRFSS